MVTLSSPHCSGSPFPDDEDLLLGPGMRSNVYHFFQRNILIIWKYINHCCLLRTLWKLTTTFFIFKYSSNIVEQKEGVILSFHNCPILKTFKKNNCKVRKVWIFFFLCFFRAGAILILLFFSRNLLTGWQALWGVLKKKLDTWSMDKNAAKVASFPSFSFQCVTTSLTPCYKRIISKRLGKYLCAIYVNFSVDI